MLSPTAPMSFFLHTQQNRMMNILYYSFVIIPHNCETFKNVKKQQGIKSMKNNRKIVIVHMKDLNGKSCSIMCITRLN